MSLSPNTSSTSRAPIHAVIVELREVAPRHFRLTLLAETIAREARAGQFVHLLPRAGSGSDPFLRRAFSIMSVGEETIDVLFRIEGRGTAYLSQLQIGETIDTLGPLGKPFDLSPISMDPLFHVKQSVKKQKVLLVGGGVGVPPMVALAAHLGSERKNDLEIVALVGARTMSDVIGADDFEALGVPVQIATDDGSMGHHGRITDLLETVLNDSNKSGGKDGSKDSSDAVVYACGPWLMLRAVASVAARYSVPAQVSLEENMPCGIGVCNGCVVAIKEVEGASHYERYRRICIEGPAVWASEIDWEVR